MQTNLPIRRPRPALGSEAKLPEVKSLARDAPSDTMTHRRRRGRSGIYRSCRGWRGCIQQEQGSWQELQRRLGSPGFSIG